MHQAGEHKAINVREKMLAPKRNETGYYHPFDDQRPVFPLEQESVSLTKWPEALTTDEPENVFPGQGRIIVYY